MSPQQRPPSLHSAPAGQRFDDQLVEQGGLRLEWLVDLSQRGQLVAVRLLKGAEFLRLGRVGIELAGIVGA